MLITLSYRISSRILHEFVDDSQVGTTLKKCDVDLFYILIFYDDRVCSLVSELKKIDS